MLASRSDLELAELVGCGRVVNVGVGGGAAVLVVDDVPVFSKRIPLSDREVADQGSTANLFELPMFCQYGVGGPSFNAWRELAGHPAVRSRLEALAAASCSLVLFCEYIPYSMSDLLRENPVGKAPKVERQFSEIVTFLGETELLHMDAHFENMRTDGGRIYLSDFGLVTSPRFDLSAAERDFTEQHRTHDADYTAMRLVNWLVTDVCGVSMSASSGPVARNEYVLRCADGRVPEDVPPAVAAILTRHAPAAARMNAFYWKLFGGDVHAEYPAGA